MKFTFYNKIPVSQEVLKDLVRSFSSKGKILSTGRNHIKVFDIDGHKINIKSFKVPNIVNKVAYRFFRKSKAQRSYEYASILIERSIGTPLPLGYAEERNTLSFGRSYYICKHQDHDLTFRELTPNDEEMLRAFTAFTYQLHEKNIHFLDHSPGNTLIKKEKGEYLFYLIDLNRMNFKKLSFEERMENFSRLTTNREMIKIMASEYSKCINRPEDEIFERMWFYTGKFQNKIQRKKRLKKYLKK